MSKTFDDLGLGGVLVEPAQPVGGLVEVGHRDEGGKLERRTEDERRGSRLLGTSRAPSQSHGFPRKGPTRPLPACDRAPERPGSW